MTEFTKYLHEVIAGNGLSRDSAARAMQIISLGGATPAQISAFLTAMKMKQETLDEVLGAITLLESPHKQLKFDKDSLFIFAQSRLEELILISFIISCLGQPVYFKLSKSNNWNAAQSLGINTDLSETYILRLLNEFGLCISFPSKTNPLRALMPIKQELDMQTLLDVIEPMASPVNSSLRIVQTDLTHYLALLKKSLLALNSRNALINVVDDQIILSNDLDSNMSFDTFDQHMDKQARLSVLRRILAGSDLKEFPNLLNFCYHILFHLNLAHSLEAGKELVDSSLLSGKVYEKFQKIIEISNEEVAKSY